MIMTPARNVTVGHFIVSTDGSPLQTTLGSCVSVIFYFSGKELAASMSHYLLDRKPANIPENFPDAKRYGDILVAEQLKEMLQFGPQKDLRAMIFGGAHSYNNHRSELISEIGNHNVEVAEEILHRERIPVTAKDTGGISARLVEFYPVRKKALERYIVEEVTKIFP